MAIRTVRTTGARLAHEHAHAAWALVRAHASMDQVSFRRALRAASLVTLWLDDDGEAVGLLIGELVDVTWRTRPAEVLVVRTAILTRALRGRPAVPTALLRWWAGRLLRRPLTSRFLAIVTPTPAAYLEAIRYTAVAWPRADRPFLPPERHVLDAAFTQVFGPSWNRRRGVIRGQGRWRTDRTPDLAHTRHYVAWNPGHPHGDALGVLMPCTVRNVVTVVRRLLAPDPPAFSTPSLTYGHEAAPGRWPG